MRTFFLVLVLVFSATTVEAACSPKIQIIYDENRITTTEKKLLPLHLGATAWKYNSSYHWKCDVITVKVKAQIEIFIDPKYKKISSCSYKEIVEHEMEHVAILRHYLTTVFKREIKKQPGIKKSSTVKTSLKKADAIMHKKLNKAQDELDLHDKGMCDPH